MSWVSRASINWERYVSPVSTDPPSRRADPLVLGPSATNWRTHRARAVLPDLPQGLPAVPGLRHHLEAAQVREQHAQAGPEQVVVVGQQHADRPHDPPSGSGEVERVSGAAIRAPRLEEIVPRSWC